LTLVADTNVVAALFLPSPHNETVLALIRRDRDWHLPPLWQSEFRHVLLIAIEAVETIVRPDGFTIPSDATAVHGITTQVAREKGLDLADVMKHFQGSLLKAEKVIAHNLQFDEKIVGAEFLRCQLPNPIESMPRAWTMLASTDLCQLQHLQVRPGRLWCKYEKVAT